MLYVNGQPFVSILAGNVNGNSKNITSMGNITFATGAALASGGTNGNTLLLKANDTTFITLTTGATDVCTLAGVTMSGTWLASGTVIIPAIQMAGNINLANSEVIGTSALRAYDSGNLSITTYITGGAGAPKAGNLVFQTGNASDPQTLVTRATMTGNAATSVLTWASIYHVGLKYGLAGTATGAFTMDGATSGVVTVTVAAVAGTWTMTLPATTGTVGQQLSTDGAGVCSWTDAASLRELKNIIGEHSPQDALDKILHTRVYDFHYKEGKGTKDLETLYTGIMADEAPWAMHYKGGTVNPVNTLGYMVLGFQAHEERIKELERELELLKAGRA